jgi:hypothetical protein
LQRFLISSGTCAPVRAPVLQQSLEQRASRDIRRDVADTAAFGQDRHVVGLISRLFGRKTSMVVTVEATLLPGNETLEVVGESRHQDALWDIVGGRGRPA